MAKVIVSLWLMSEDLGADFTRPSSSVSEITLNVDDGSTVRNVFTILAGRYPAIDEKVFRRGTEQFSNAVVVLINDGMFPAGGVLERVLMDGEKVAVVPAYFGG